MGSKKKAIDKLPDSFETEEEAGMFWDAHSVADYLENLEPIDESIDIKERVFEVRISEDVFQKLRQEAATSRRSVPKVVDKILRKELTSV